MPPGLALLSTLNGSNYPCLELIFMVPKVFEPLKLDCIYQSVVLCVEANVVLEDLSWCKLWVLPTKSVCIINNSHAMVCPPVREDKQATCFLAI